MRSDAAFSVCQSSIKTMLFVLVSTGLLLQLEYILLRRLVFLSWRRLWEIALDKGVKGIRILQRVFKELSRPKPCSKCNLCESGSIEESCFEHVCIHHFDVVGDLSCDLFIFTLIEANSDSIFSKCSCMSNCTFLWSFHF